MANDRRSPLDLSTRMTLAIEPNPRVRYPNRKRTKRLPSEEDACWDGRTDKGETATNGIDFCHLKMGGFQETKKRLKLQE